MLRLINRRLIIPRGDSGSFALPTLGIADEGNVAIFSIFDTLTRETLLEKRVDASEDFIYINLTHDDTNIPAGKYYWDIKIYREPQFDEDGVLIGGEEVDSYYSAYRLPLCIVKEVPRKDG